MQLDVSFLPAYGAAFMLMFARIGTMVMLLPGLGELSVPARIRLTVALLLTMVLFPLHRAGYTIDLRTPGPVLIALGQELLIGMVLGLTARLTISALQVAGSVIAQQLGLGFVTAVDPTQGQQGLIVGNFLTLLGVTLIFATDLHHLVIAGLHDSYQLFRPGEVPSVTDVVGARDAHDRRSVPRRQSSSRRRSWCSASCSTSALGRAVAADAADAGLLRRGAAFDHDRLPDPAVRGRRDDGKLPRLSRRRAARAGAYSS
jgi:hypothetical protein